MYDVGCTRRNSLIINQLFFLKMENTKIIQAGDKLEHASLKETASFARYLWDNKLVILAVSLVLLNWVTAEIKPNNLMLDVNPPFQIPFFETHYLYFLMHAFAFIPVFLMSFDKKVAFFKTWKSLFPALFTVAIIFWVWDIFKTDSQVWGFNPKYYTQLLGNLPIEEWLFFITFPFCCVFIYECLDAYFPNDTFAKFDGPLSIIFGFGFLAVGLLFWNNSYTATTWIPAGLFALWHFYRFPNTYRTKFYRAFFVGLIPFFIVNSVFAGISTAEPLVIYNPEEYLGVRIGVIPLDDFVYNFLLEFMIIYFFERFRRK
jgi:lycopene cyclase domain-containing protein